MKSSEAWQLCVDTNENGLLKGWAYKVDNPNCTVMLKLSSTAGEEGIFAADVYRKDLHEIGKGNGRHGFEINLGHWNLMDNIITVQPIGDGGRDVSIALSFDLTSEIQRQEWLPSYQALMQPFLIISNIEE